jgi:hypothetical protein
MLQNREKLEKFLEKYCENIALKTELSNKIRDYINEKYKVPTGKIMDMISRSMLQEQTEFVLFCLLDGIDSVYNTNHKAEWYTELEISTYSNTVFEIEKIKFPIILNCVKVADDQWIGAADSDFLLELRKAQLINYNANAQRVMKRIIKGENVLFKIGINKIAIKAIRTLMKNKMYIPTTITLNIPYASDTDFVYNEKEKVLIINSIKAFDISDGYHRYLAMCEESEVNKDFKYPIEIRIVNFTEEKTRQFIFQEDQKTKMARIDSKTMNTNRESNIVIDRLNEMSSFDLKGCIGRNEGTVSYNGLSEIIEYYYFKGKKKYSNLDIINAANDVKRKLNTLTSFNTDYLTKPLRFRELAVIFYCFDIEEDEEKACKMIDKIMEKDLKSLNKYQTMTKAIKREISQLI